MSTRTRLTPVYLTVAERDLACQAIDVLTDQLEPGKEYNSSSTRFARSFTRQRLLELRALFEDKETTT